MKSEGFQSCHGISNKSIEDGNSFSVSSLDVGCLQKTSSWVEFVPSLSCRQYCIQLHLEKTFGVFAFWIHSSFTKQFLGVLTYQWSIILLSINKIFSPLCTSTCHGKVMKNVLGWILKAQKLSVELVFAIPSLQDASGYKAHICSTTLSNVHSSSLLLANPLTSTAVANLNNHHLHKQKLACLMILSPKDYCQPPMIFQM